MLCDNCGKEYDDIIPFCPFCGSRKESDDADATISDEDFSEIDRLLGYGGEGDGAEPNQDTAGEKTAGETVTEAAQETYGEDTSEVITSDAEIEATADDAGEAQQEGTAEKAPTAEPAPEIKVTAAKPRPASPTPKPQPKDVAPKKAQETQSEKQAKRFIACLVSFMAVFLAAVSAVGLFTDTFKTDEGVKAMALLGLTFQEEGELEAYLESIGPLVQRGFDSDDISAEEFLDILAVGSESGLYATMGNKAKLLKDSSDPAERYRITDELLVPEAKTYSYYRVTADVIDEILASFGVEANHTVNNSRVYFYRDSYFFSAEENQSDAAVGLKFDIKESKRIQDGGYYIVCSVLNATDTEAMRAYIIAEKVKEEDGKSYSWVISKISHEPMFDSLGIVLSEEGEPYSYEMKTEIIQAETKDGRLWCSYVIEYPLFSGTSQGEQAINTLYQSLITAYKSEAENANKNYKAFLKEGYDEDDLPRQIHIRGEVTYNEEKYVSVVNEIATSPTTKPADSETGEDEIITLSRRSFEGYVFDMASGEFVSKDTIVGKDYLKMSELLYRIYCGYDYTSVLSDVEDTEAIPEDSENIGLKFYEGASALCEEGYAFYTADAQGRKARVVIPYDTAGIFSERF